jgi:PAS domain S-box-containing protein
MDGSQDTELLRQSEERHRLLAEHANDVVWTMSPDGLITYVSPAVEAMRGFTPEEAMNQSLEQIHPPESQAVNRAYFERLGESLKNGTPPEEFQGELEYYCKDGSTVWTYVQVIPHMDETSPAAQTDGQPVRFGCDPRRGWRQSKS